MGCDRLNLILSAVILGSLAPVTATASRSALDEVVAVVGSTPNSGHSFASARTISPCDAGLGCFNMWEQHCAHAPATTISACPTGECLPMVLDVAQWELDCSSTPEGVSPPFGEGIRIRRRAAGATEPVLTAARNALDSEGRNATACQSRASTERCLNTRASSFDDYLATLRSLETSRFLQFVSPAYVSAVRAELARTPSVVAASESRCRESMATLAVNERDFASLPSCGGVSLPSDLMNRLREEYGHAYRRHQEEQQLQAFSTSLEGMASAPPPVDWASARSRATDIERWAVQFRRLQIREAADVRDVLAARYEVVQRGVLEVAGNVARTSCERAVTTAEQAFSSLTTSEEVRRALDNIEAQQRRLAQESAGLVSSEERAAFSARLDAARVSVLSIASRIEAAERVEAERRALEEQEVARQQAAARRATWCEANPLSSTRRHEIDRAIARALSRAADANAIAAQMPMFCLEQFQGIELHCAAIALRRVAVTPDEAQRYLTCHSSRR